MSVANRQASFMATMRWEGRDKISLDPRDAGNWTGGKQGIGKLIGSKFGVSAQTCARMFPGKAMADLTIADALSVFVSGYWAPCSCDVMPAGLDHCVSDDAYNSGPASALGRYRSLPNLDAVAAVHAYSAKRLSFLQALANWPIYGRGWAARVAGVEAEAVAMAHADSANSFGVILSDHLAAKSNEADEKSGSARNIAIGAAAAGGLAVAASAAPASLAIAIGAGLVAIHQFWQAHFQAARRDALGEAADKAENQ